MHASTVLPPSEAGGLPPSRRQDPGFGWGLYIMQDTPNSYLEAERRESFFGILGRGLGRRGDFTFVDLCRPGGSWPPPVLGRAPRAILQTCAWHDFDVRFGPCRVGAGAVFAEQVQIHCSGHISRSLSVSRFRRVCFRGARVFLRSPICVALAVPGLHLCSAALPLRSCRHALGMISLFVLVLVEL